MALVKCEECGHDVSAQAGICPHCGAPQGYRIALNAEPLQLKKKGGGRGALIFVILAGVLIITFFSQWGSNTSDVPSASSTPATPEATTPAATTPAATAPTATDPTPATPTQTAEPAAQAKEQYMAQVATEYESLKTFDVSKWTDTKERIISCTALFSTLVQVAENAKKFQLMPEEVNTVEKLKEKIAAVQVAAFPKLRNAFGPAMRKLLREGDMSVRTIRTDYKVIEWVGAAFAGNRYKWKWQTDMQGTLYKLRFTRSRYKLRKEDDGFTHYMMGPPKDSQLVEWTGDITFRVID